MTSNLGVEVIRTKVLILPIACFAEPNPSVNWLINAAIRIIEAKKPAFSGTTLSHTLSMLFISNRMGIVTALSNKNGYCHAQNRYFADLYNVSNETVSRWISHLQSLGYIYAELIRNEQQVVISRHIYVVDL